MVSHAIEMGLLVVALVAFGDYRALEFLPFTLLLMVIMAVFALGFGLLLSAINVYFRDIEHFMNIIFLVWLYMTPIIYPITTKGVAKYVTFLKLNPMTDAVCVTATCSTTAPTRVGWSSAILPPGPW
jgi:ABC-type polysaccharide/polyol phosphate export permease